METSKDLTITRLETPSSNKQVDLQTSDSQTEGQKSGSDTFAKQDASSNTSNVLSILQNSKTPEGNSEDLVNKRNASDENENERVLPETFKRRKVEIYGKDSGPKWYKVQGDIVTPPIISKNLPDAFDYLPIYGKPKNKSELDEFHMNKIREFVGCDLNDEEFDKLSKYCSPDNLKTGKELVMLNDVPNYGLLPNDIECPTTNEVPSSDCAEHELCVVKKSKLRAEKDKNNQFMTRLKYRGLRLVPMVEDNNPTVTIGQPLEPGKDLLFRVRIYRPFQYCIRDRLVSRRHSVFSRDVVLLGRHWLTELRDRLVCPNDVDLRVDVSDNPDEVSLATAKEAFPSGFLFINNVFYVDERAGCQDRSAPVRAWAAERGLGHFPRRGLADLRLADLTPRLGHPEVYVHQGNCEHLFTFSEIRLLNASDPLKLSHYPCHTALSHNHSLYCTTCAEFSAKWIVTGCNRVPFDPAFFCETCMKLFLYQDGKKIGDFKAYLYTGNDINMLKSQI